MLVFPWLLNVMFGGPQRRKERLNRKVSAAVSSVLEPLEKRVFLSADPSLLAAYSFSEAAGSTVVDASGNGHTGNVANGAEWTAGASGTGLALDGLQRQRVMIADDATLDATNALTLSVWVKPGQGRPPEIIVEKAKFGTADGYELGMSTDGTFYFRLNQVTSGNRYRVDSTTQFPIDDTSWVHVEATYDGSTMRLYINGVQEAQKNGPESINENKYGVSIGGQQNGQRSFTGEIDEVQIYGRALSAAEIAADHGVIPPTTDPTGGTTDPTGGTTDPTGGTTDPTGGTTDPTGGTTDPTGGTTDPTGGTTDPTGGTTDPTGGTTDPTGGTTDPTDGTTDPTPPDTEAGLTLLFYGNSFTNGYQKGAGDVTPVPSLLSQIAVAAGHPAPTIDNEAVDGKDLAYALAHFKADAVPANVDYVVMQEFSSKPTDIAYNNLGDPKEFEADVKALYQLITGIAPDALPVLYETWAQPPADSVNLSNLYPKASTSTAASNQMQAELRKYYNQAAAQLDALAGSGSTLVAQVGDAFQQLGYTGLYSSDNHHADNKGYALSAMVMYDTIYQGSVKNVDLSKVFSQLKISASDGADLKAAADAIAA